MIKTERLILRPWKESDLEPFAKLNADPRVMEYFPSTLSREESDQMVRKIQAKMEEKGWGLWAVSVPAVADFIGFIGLYPVDPSNLQVPFAPTVEIGWRLAFDYWGHGYATEGAMACLKFGFETLKLNEIVSFTAIPNERSQRVMERIGMHRNPKDDFDHPKLAIGHSLRRHVLYRMDRAEWKGAIVDTKRKIEVVAYDPQWPEMFESEAKRIKQALGSNCLMVHHIGSTSIPGLSAKPIIDMIPVVRTIQEVDQATEAMESLGYDAKGENGIAFRRYFQKGDQQRTHHVHVFQEGYPEIERHIKFREWMCSHPAEAEKYAKLKLELAKKFPHDILSYCNGKEEFIASIDAKDGFEGCRLVQALTDREWTSVRNLRHTYFFQTKPDPFAWTFTHKDHIHFVFYRNTEIIGYTHLQLWPENRAALRIIVIDEQHRNHGYGGQFLRLCELWLQHRGFQYLHIQSSKKAYPFYLQHGYTQMPFKDPEDYERDPKDIEIGKCLQL